MFKVSNKRRFALSLIYWKIAVSFLKNIFTFKCFINYQLNIQCVIYQKKKEIVTKNIVFRKNKMLRFFSHCILNGKIMNYFAEKNRFDIG